MNNTQHETGSGWVAEYAARVEAAKQNPRLHEIPVAVDAINAEYGVTSRYQRRLREWFAARPDLGDLIVAALRGDEAAYAECRDAVR